MKIHHRATPTTPSSPCLKVWYFITKTFLVSTNLSPIDDLHRSHFFSVFDPLRDTHAIIILLLQKFFVCLFVCLFSFSFSFSSLVLIFPAVDDYGFHKKCFELQFKIYHSV